MAPAAYKMKEALAAVNIQAPAVPVVSNVRAAGVSDPDEIRELLVQQVTGSVRWRESVMWMASQGVDQIWEIGAGKALTGMVRRIDRAIDCKAIGTAADVAAAAQA
jgi:[acyl-carrier-protein] S-malonyltransferase